MYSRRLLIFCLADPISCQPLYKRRCTTSPKAIRNTYLWILDFAFSKMHLPEGSLLTNLSFRVYASKMTSIEAGNTSPVLTLRRLLTGFDVEGLRNDDPFAGSRRKPKSRWTQHSRVAGIPLPARHSRFGRSTSWHWGWYSRPARKLLLLFISNFSRRKASFDGVSGHHPGHGELQQVVPSTVL